MNDHEIELWKDKEINCLKRKIRSYQYSIDLYSIELKNIKHERRITVEDFTKLNNKYGNINYNKELVKICYIKMGMLKYSDISKEKYHTMPLF